MELLSIKKNLKKFGTVLIKGKENFISLKDFNKIEKILHKIRIQQWVTREKNNVNV